MRWGAVTARVSLRHRRSTTALRCPVLPLLATMLLLGMVTTASQAGGAFLEGRLPLRVVATTPSALASFKPGGAPLLLSGRAALTAVFSRPVIALGSDWGSAQLPAALIPFDLSGCGVPGRMRWVTTSIFRWDSSIDLPTDLECSLIWNANLTSYDGEWRFIHCTAHPQRGRTHL